MLYRHRKDPIKKLRIAVLLTALLVAPSQAWAGKVEKVKKAVKDKCNREIPVELLTSAVVRAYDCQPDQLVTVGGCKITCLKEQDGSVVGR